LTPRVARASKHWSGWVRVAKKAAGVRFEPRKRGLRTAVSFAPWRPGPNAH
jgi:hypothetical protein